MTDCTEVAFVPLRPTAHVLDGQYSVEREILDSMVKKAHMVPSIQRYCWGLEVENPDNCWLMVDYDSLQAHRDFMAMPWFPAFLARAIALVNPERATVFGVAHIAFKPHPSIKALLSPITQVLRAHFPVSASEILMSEFENDVKHLVSALVAAGTNGLTGHFSTGWTVEDVALNWSDKELNDERKVFMALIGWESVAAHVAATETKVFKENLGDRSKYSEAKITTVHVNFNKY